MQTIEDVLELLRAVRHQDEFIATMMEWTDKPHFPLHEALCQCGEGTLILEDHSYNPPTKESVKASAAIKLILSPFFVSEVSQGEVCISAPTSLRIYANDEGLGNYYIIFLIAKLWALKHEPKYNEADLNQLAAIWDLEQYLEKIPEQENLDLHELVEKAVDACLPAQCYGMLEGNAVHLDLYNTLAGLLVGNYRIEIDGAMGMTITTITGIGKGNVVESPACPWCDLIIPAKKWLEKHPAI